MSTSTRLEADLVFSLADQMTGTITASGLDIEVYSSAPELFVQAGTVKLKALRSVAAGLAERGLTVSVLGPNGLIVRIGAARASLLQRVLTGSRHIGLGNRKAWGPLLRRPSAGTTTAAVGMPPATLVPLVPTFDRRIRRKITTTHYAFGAGRPRLVFVVGSENWSGQMPREFELLPGTTTIGSSPSADLQLPGLQPFHAEIRHDSNDEYVLHSLAEVAGGSQSLPGAQTGRRVLRTGARMEMAQWRIGFFREEYADHGRPHGGRRGGELAYQKPQPDRQSDNRPPTAP
jgi:hypothetical protein